MSLQRQAQYPAYACARTHEMLNNPCGANRRQAFLHAANRGRVQQSVAHIEEAPAVRALRSIGERALAAAASDVHLEPSPKGGRVRLRVDGLLREDLNGRLCFGQHLVMRQVLVKH